MSKINKYLRIRTWLYFGYDYGAPKHTRLNFKMLWIRQGATTPHTAFLAINLLKNNLATELFEQMVE